MNHLTSIVVCAALLAGTCFCDAAGLTVRDGRLYRNDQVSRCIGVNYCDMFQEMIHDADDLRTMRGLRFLGEKGIPFVRFWSCGFWPSDWDLYFEDKDEWFRRMDILVQTAEETGVGLIPSMFWRTATYPDLFDEFNDAWGDPESKTRKFMAQYVREVVGRYKDSPAIWGWEFANEMNLSCDLPNGMNFLGKSIPHLKVDLKADPRNLMTYDIARTAYIAFAEEVRTIDPERFITTGNSIPRECSWHNAKEKTWTNDDLKQMREVFGWMNPAPIDVVSAHFYPKYASPPQFAGVEGIAEVLSVLKRLSADQGQPLFVGEFAAAAHDKESALTMDQFREQQTAILDGLLATGVDLAAYWVFDYTRDRKGPGLVRADNEYAWVIDQIVEYNKRLAGVE